MKSIRTAEGRAHVPAGLLRVFDDPSTKKETIERCDNGSWKKVPESEPR